MKDIYLKRNKLREASLNLRSAKFDTKVKTEQGFKLDEVQDKIYKEYKFYDNFLKARNKSKEVKQ